MKTILDFANEYADSGLSVIPIKTDGSKQPSWKSWKQHQDRIATPDERRRMFGRNVGAAVIGGVVSGGLEVIDFDEPGLHKRFCELVEAEQPGLLERLPHVRTPKDGDHLYYRCEQIEGNQKLAMRPRVNAEGKPDPETLIETRGEGGYVVAPGSPAECHERRLPYVHVGGPPIIMAPNITVEERALLFSIARRFDERPPEVPREPKPTNGKPRDGLAPGDDYNLRATWEEILTPHGWAVAFTQGEVTHWRRPGKRIGTSATTGLRSQEGNELFCVFSSNAAPFEGPTGASPCSTYTKFGAYAILNHAGDFSEAAKALAQHGYGERPHERNGSAAEKPGDTNDASQTEAGNARRFAAKYGKDVRWCDPWGKWLVWDSRRWKVDDVCRMEQYGKGVAADVLREFGVCKFSRETNKRAGVSNMLALARSESGTPVLPEALDCDPWFLNVENGTLDLRTGRIRPHDRGDLITKLAPVKHDPGADCPLWLDFLRVVTGGDADLITFLRRLVGYSLTGSVRDHVLPFLYGLGSNGKSVFLNTVLALLGDDYAMKAPPDLLMTKKGQAHPTERADLFGKRFVAAIEAEDGRRMAEALVKELTGGDKVRARRMREDFWEFPPTHKVWLAANHKPTIRGTDYGIWRRVKLVPFTVTIPPERQDKQLTEKLRDELPGILNWALLGCIEWQAQGLGEPCAVVEATAAYRDEMDTLRAFLEDCCTIDHNATVGATPLYAAYVEWCGKSGERPAKQREFGVRLSERGFEIIRGTGGRKVRRGIGLASERSEP